MGKLSTHILDTSLGLPAEGLTLKLYRKENNKYIFLKEACTNHDGRCNEALLIENDFKKGGYELVFDVSSYFAKKGIESFFLQDVVIRFYVDDNSKNYHIPLLVTPYSYSTYKGS